VAAAAAAGAVASAVRLTAANTPPPTAAAAQLLPPKQLGQEGRLLGLGARGRPWQWPQPFRGCPTGGWPANPAATPSPTRALRRPPAGLGTPG
jgi:hypothetical protein